MTTARSSTATLIAAMFKLSQDIESRDGVASAAIYEAAKRLNDLRTLIHYALPIVRAHHGAVHMLDGFKPKPSPIIDTLLADFEREVV